MDKTYQAPVLVEVGSVAELTLGGHGGGGHGGGGGGGGKSGGKSDGYYSYPGVPAS